MDVDHNALLEFAAGIRRSTIEEIAIFVETHYCIWDFGGQNYILHERTPHPKEPLAAAIRGLKSAPTEAAQQGTQEKP